MRLGDLTFDVGGRLYEVIPGEWLSTTAITESFTDMLRNMTPAGQAALVAAANDKIAGTRWRPVKQTN